VGGFLQGFALNLPCATHVPAYPILRYWIVLMIFDEEKNYEALYYAVFSTLKFVSKLSDFTLSSVKSS
jgi:hypothetical protein